MSFILLQYVPVPVLKNLGKIAIFFWKIAIFWQFVFDFVFYTKPALFCLTPSSLFLSAQNSKQKKSLNHSIIIIHNPIKKSELILINASTPPTPLKSSDDPFDPLHIRLVEMFRFVFKNWKNIHWFDKKTFLKVQNLQSLKFVRQLGSELWFEKLLDFFYFSFLLLKL